MSTSNFKSIIVDGDMTCTGTTSLSDANTNTTKQISRMILSNYNYYPVENVYGLNAITYGNGLFVVLTTTNTTNNSVMISNNGKSWKTFTLPTNENQRWKSITYGNGVFVAVSLFGTIIVSSDAIVWTIVRTINSEQWTSVTYGNGLFVAVSGISNNGFITSPDGYTWSPNSNVRNTFCEITYGNGMFVAVSDSAPNLIYTSTDGLNWNSYAGRPGNWASVTYGNGLFVAVAGNDSEGSNAVDGRVMTSPDGINWSMRSAELNNWTSITYGNGMFLAVSIGGTNAAMTSTDSITWTPRYSTNSDLTAVAYGNGIFVALSLDSTILTLGEIITPIEDNKNQSICIGTNDRICYNYPLNYYNVDNNNTNLSKCISYGNGLYVIIQNNRDKVWTSPDGTNWTIRNSFVGYWVTMVYGNGLFVVLADNGTNRLMTSPDGINWTLRTVDLQPWNSVIYTNGMFYAVSSNGKMMTSSNGILWNPVYTIVSESITINARAITYGNGVFVLFARETQTTTKVYTSNDAMVWTLRATLSGSCRQLIYENGLFVAVGDSNTGANTVKYSNDGITWNTSPILINYASSVTYGNGLFVVTGDLNSELLAFSKDAISWSYVSVIQKNWLSITYSHGLFVAVAYQNQSNQIMTWGEFITSESMVIGNNSSVTSRSSIVVGNNSSAYGSSSIAIGHDLTVNDNNQIVLGSLKDFIRLDSGKLYLPNYIARSTSEVPTITTEYSILFDMNSSDGITSSNVIQSILSISNTGTNKGTFTNISGKSIILHLSVIVTMNDFTTSTLYMKRNDTIQATNAFTGTIGCMNTVLKCLPSDNFKITITSTSQTLMNSARITGTVYFG